METICERVRRLGKETKRECVKPNQIGLGGIAIPDHVTGRTLRVSPVFWDL